MSDPTFHPIARENGRLDPASFESMGDAWIESWLRARLSGSDSYFPIDTRWDEDPESLVVGLLRDAGPAHPAAVAIGRAAFRLLDEARQIVRQTGEEPDSSSSVSSQASPYLNALLGLCQGLRIEQTFSWFREELAEIARDPDAARLRWGGLRTVREILFAAVVQAPGRPLSPLVEPWSALLRVSELSSLALAGLGKTFEEKLPHLAAWWRSCPPDQIDRELDYMIGRALDREEPILDLLEQLPKFPKKLRVEIESISEAMGAQTVAAFPLPAVLKEYPNPAVVMPAAIDAAGQPISAERRSEGVIRALYKVAWRAEFLGVRNGKEPLLLDELYRLRNDRA